MGQKNSGKDVKREKNRLQLWHHRCLELVENVGQRGFDALRNAPADLKKLRVWGKLSKTRS